MTDRRGMGWLWCCLAHYLVGRVAQAKCYREGTEFKTPNLDRLATEGRRFTDEHSAASVCTPTRDGVITQDEIDTLNRLVVIFLEQAELRVKQKKDLTLDYWRASVDKMLTSNEQPLLEGPGSVSHDDMKRVAHDRYDAFDENRRAAEALATDAEDLKEIENLEDKLKKNKP